MIKRTGAILAVIILISFITFSSNGWGQGPPRLKLETTSPQKLHLTVGKSIIIQSPGAVRRVSLVSPEIADVMVLTPHQIYLTGKASGLTHVTLWDVGDKVIGILDLEISPDISRLKEMLYKILPEEKDVRVNSTHDQITLSGTVSSAANLSQVLALAGPFAPLDEKKEPKIINLLEVAGVHQVMLEVRVSEISRSLLRRLGFNFNYIGSSGRNLGLSLLNKLTSLPAGGLPSAETPAGGIPSAGVAASDSINAIFRFLSWETTWTVFIDALKEVDL